MDVLPLEALEQNDVVDSIQKFRCEGALEGGLNHVVTVGVGVGCLGSCTKAYARPEFGELSCADVRRHDDDRVAEIHLSSQAVSQLAVVQGLEQQVEHVGVGLFYFIQQDDGVGAAANLFGELPTFFVTNVSRRCSDESCHSKLFHVLGHVDANEGLLAVEHEP